ncbi:PstS family phosphate ABC transporter substrate-binding protein [Saliterribacillus persicus]|uniref:Phosphate transport system substrate-binding protein n=1 Tax=Saliterribacillus persicus TaxID=930114 RepID=A0A368XX10_9BACI|nr:substrate-binding domain-containing protein [Saliterribacillus persicus]RCW72019.1 phosphate transport system substrate-binding protein [Saliterribacillus persicus]
MNQIGKVIVSLVLTGAMIFISFTMIIGAAFTGLGEYPIMFIFVVALTTIIITNCAIFMKGTKKNLKKFTLFFYSVATVILISYVSYQVYQDKLEIVSNQDVDLESYQPASDNDKLVSLDSEPTISITENLPVLVGATALYPLYAAFVKAVYPEGDYNLEDDENIVLASQTGNAYQNLFRGEVDIIFTAGPSERQEKQAENRNVSLDLTPIGKEAFVFFVHADNPVTELTVKEVQAIYSGEITNWNQVGGKDEEIRAFQRPADSGSQTMLEKVMDGKRLMEPPTDEIVSGMGGIIRETANYKNKTDAIGFTFRYFASEMVDKGKIKFVQIDGIDPNKENINNDTYPFTAEFYAITRTDYDNNNIPLLIDWITSEQGQQIIEKTGYVPLKQ